MVTFKRNLAVLSTAFSLFFSSSIQAEAAPPIDRRVIQYQVNKGNITGAVSLYQDYKRQTLSHDFQLLRDIGLSILDEGSQSRDPEVLFLSCFGGGVCFDDEASLRIFERCMNTPNPQLHMVGMHFLSTLQNEYADQLIVKALSSPYLPIRLEAAHLLLTKQHAEALHQLESLFYKTNEKLHPLFPQLVALVGSRDASPMMKRFLASSDEQVRLQAILSIAKHQREEFVDIIRNLSHQVSVSQQEACAFALGQLRDSYSIESLKSLSSSQHPNVKIASLLALNKLGISDEAQSLIPLAENDDLLAIAALSQFPSSRDLLVKFLDSDNIQVQFNAALALLEMKDARCIPVLKRVLVSDEKDYGIQQLSSFGNSLMAWKLIPSSHSQFKKQPYFMEISTQLKERILVKAFRLNESDALTLADHVFRSNQKMLVPVLVRQLEQLGTDKAIALLHKYHQKPGAPLTRNYCTLALYRLGIEGHYEQQLINWITAQQNTDIFSFRPLLPWQFREEDSIFQLTPKETSRLMIETFETLSQSQSSEGIDALVNAIANGNEKNKYVLAGLLIRGVE